MSKRSGQARREPSYFDDRVVLHVRRATAGKKLTTDQAGQGLSRKAIARALDRDLALELDCTVLSRKPTPQAASSLLTLARQIGVIGHGHGQRREHMVMSLVGMSEQLSAQFEHVLGHHAPKRLDVIDRSFTLSPATRTVYSPSITLALRWERSPYKAQQLQRLIDRDGACCSWCATPMSAETMAATVDHVRPRSQGGPNGLDNLLLSCYACNHSRGDVPADEWLRQTLAAGRTPVVPNVLAALDRAGLTHGGLVLVKGLPVAA